MTSTTCSSVSRASRAWNSYTSRVSAVTVAEIMCGDDAASPADTMVTYSSSEPGTDGASATMFGTRAWATVPPRAIFSPMATSRSYAADRAFSLTSLADITTSERTEGTK